MLKESNFYKKIESLLAIYKDQPIKDSTTLSVKSGIEYYLHSLSYLSSGKHTNNVLKWHGLLYPSFTVNTDNGKYSIKFDDYDHLTSWLLDIPDYENDDDYYKLPKSDNDDMLI